ncbi:MAG: anaerobic glycerol-3-phosphate dehydrogenase subunit B [Anaerolineae bacterium]|nr:anaerobic glycerol-3-phosphate dehydrogenase subunit B [Anaerolineae bacterium]
MDDVIVVGAGWSGLAAAAMALERGLKVRLIAQGIGTIIVTPGWISVWDSARGDVRMALQDLVARVPDHPYALAGLDAVEASVRLWREFTAKVGLPFVGELSHQKTLATALGTAQQAVLTAPGHSGEIGRQPLYVGFTGWRDYYPTLTGAHTAVIDLPDRNRAWDATPADIAREFDDAGYRQQVVSSLKPRLNGATSVGFPAVLGMEDPAMVVKDLSTQLGVPVFEMPTLPPSVPGTRLFQHFRRYFLDHRMRFQVGHPVERGLVRGRRVTGVEVAAAGKPQLFEAKAVILATGGLYGGGLASDDRGEIWEPIFGLPVQYDHDRTRWFSDDLLDPRGHAVHYFGVRVNDRMQPLDEQGKVVLENLYLCGHLIARPHVDGTPAPTESGEGVALATAWKAVQQV